MKNLKCIVFSLALVLSTFPPSFAYAQAYTVTATQAGAHEQEQVPHAINCENESCYGSFPVVLKDGESAILDMAVLFNVAGADLYFKLNGEYLSGRNLDIKLYIPLGGAEAHRSIALFYTNATLPQEDIVRQDAVLHIAQDEALVLEVVIKPVL